MQALQRGVKTIFGSYAVGADGAVTANTPKIGWTSVTKDATGVHSILLDDKYYSLLHADAICLKSTASAAPAIQLKAETVATTKIVTFIFMDKEHAAADPVSTTVYFEIKLANSGV